MTIVDANGSREIGITAGEKVGQGTNGFGLIATRSTDEEGAGYRIPIRQERFGNCLTATYDTLRRTYQLEEARYRTLCEEVAEAEMMSRTGR